MRAKKLLLEISQADLDILTAAVTESHAALRNVSAQILDGRIRVSGEYAILPVRVRFAGEGAVRVTGENTLAIDVHGVSLGSLIRFPPAWACRALSHILSRHSVGGGVSAHGSTLLVDVTRLRLPFPAGLVDMSFREIRILPGLIQVALL
ncbi:MAG: hypothetical protein GXX08_04590 [Firmicutes bacterium]|nr:hypothetical protein [Bacillota bacterium]